MNEIRMDTARGRWIIAVMALGSGMIFLDGTVVNVALPRIQADLATPLSGLQWIVNAYTLVLAAFLMVGGGLGDIYGRKRMFALGLAIFTLASVLCGLAPGLGILIAARALQGVGGVLLVPESLAIIQAVFVREDRGRAIGLWAGLSGVTTAIGPLLGGYLVGAVSWRAIFFLNVPIGAITLYALLIHVPESRDSDAPQRLDYPGAAAAAVGLAGITYGLIEGPQVGWTAPRVLLALGAGIVALLLFPLRESMATRPMVPLGVFRSRNFSGSNLAALLVYFAFTGALLFLTLDLQQVQGYSPLQAGAALIPVTLLLLSLSPRVGGLTTRFGTRLFMTVGPVLIACGFLFLTLSGVHSSYPRAFLPGIIVFGVGMSMFVTPLTTTVMSSLPQHLTGVASGFNNAVTRVASLLAIAVLGVVFSTRFDSGLRAQLPHTPITSAARIALLAHENRLADDPIPSSVPPGKHTVVRAVLANAFQDGFRWSMAFCAVVSLLAAVTSLLTIRVSELSSGVPGVVES